MRFHIVTSLLALASTSSAAITWTLQKAANPTTDQADAYSKIEAAMKLAVAHYAKFSDATKSLTIQYEVSPGWARFLCCLDDYCAGLLPPASGGGRGGFRLQGVERGHCKPPSIRI